MAAGGRRDRGGAEQRGWLAVPAAGAFCLQLLGDYDDPDVKLALESLQAHDYKPQMDAYFHSMNYYTMQAHFQAGEERLNGAAKCYSTAMAAITLEVYMHYLSAYQR